MGRDELTLYVAAALFGAVVLGWILGAVFRSLNGASRGDARAAADLADRLHRAEDDAARLKLVERELTAELAEVRSELGEALRSLDRSRAEVDEIREAYRRAAGPRPQEVRTVDG